MKIRVVAFFLISFFLLGATNGHSQERDSRNNLAPGKLNLAGTGKFKRLLKKENTVLIDVRTPKEFNASHLPGAINFDIKQGNFQNHLEGLDKTKTYLLYCGTARRSDSALRIMKTSGFNNIFQLKGGIENWKGRVE